MKPASSVIAFTTLAGAGYGLLMLLAVHLAFAPAVIGRPVALATALLAFVLVAAGLSSSLLHLGQPLRAWRALSQWRSSWLSREGVAALVTFVPHLALIGMLWVGERGVALRVAAIVCVLGAILTLYCTARIYASLRTIRAWNNGFTVPTYFVLALWSGAIAFWAIQAALAGTRARAPFILAALLTVVALGLKLAYWRYLAARPHEATPESATGLGHLGTVRQFEAPHTEENYLLREMGFRLARKHAGRLRGIVVGALVLVLALLLAALADPALGNWMAWPALAALAAGLAAERWLFFAEARHVVTLFYGARSA